MCLAYSKVRNDPGEWLSRAQLDGDDDEAAFSVAMDPAARERSSGLTVFASLLGCDSGVCTTHAVADARASSTLSSRSRSSLQHGISGLMRDVSTALSAGSRSRSVDAALSAVLDGDDSVSAAGAVVEVCSRRRHTCLPRPSASRLPFSQARPYAATGLHCTWWRRRQ